MWHVLSQKRGQSKNLPRSHLVFPKALWNRKQAKPSAYGQPHPVCFRKLLLPPGSKPLPSLFGILVAVSTSSLESCLGESPLALVIATSPEKSQKIFQNHPSCSGRLELQPCAQAPVLPSITLSNLETFPIFYSHSPPWSFQGGIAARTGVTKSTVPTQMWPSQEPGFKDSWHR